ncbi:MAG TPA: macro domain-containing protein [Pirellulales bacterium]|nr:macro domain-containing protein [Pirellulales bacterium]
MRRMFNDAVVELYQGDMSDEKVDVIVNAANSRLAGGGGVDGAIHRRGGSEIMADTDRRYPEGCPAGSAVISVAGRLAARFVIHAVGPVWAGGSRGEADVLSGAFRRSLELAVEHHCHSIAFPAISTGVYGYPIDLASRAALTTVRDFLLEHGRPALVRFVLFGPGAYGAFAAALEEI